MILKVVLTFHTYYLWNVYNHNYLKLESYEYSKTCLKRNALKQTPAQSGQKICPKISVYWSKSNRHNLSKVDTCLKRTKIMVPKVSAFDRFYFISILLLDFYRILKHVRLDLNFTSFLLHFCKIIKDYDFDPPNPSQPLFQGLLKSFVYFIISSMMV